MAFDINNLLNSVSRENEESAAVYNDIANEQKIEMIDVYELTPSEDNFYKTENIEELAISIELLGSIKQPLLIKRYADGTEEIRVGHRRSLAAKMLVEEGKEKYRYVPCVIEDAIENQEENSDPEFKSMEGEENELSQEDKEKLTLILTNSTTRILTEWERIQQYKQIKLILEKYRKKIRKENEKKPKEEKVKLGRTRDIIEKLLDISSTVLSRYEKIDNSLIGDFKEELKEQNINISTAHEIARKSVEEQQGLYQEFKEKGELHITDVTEKEKQVVNTSVSAQVAEEQEANKEHLAEDITIVKAVILDVIKSGINRDIFENQDNILTILKKYLYHTYQGSSVYIEDGRKYHYRFSTFGVTVLTSEWGKKCIFSFEELSVIILAMIEDKELYVEPELEAERQVTSENPECEPKSKIADFSKYMPEPEESKATVNQDKIEISTNENEENLNDMIQGQSEIIDFPEYMPDIEPGLSFTDWIVKRYDKGQYAMIKEIVTEKMINIELEEKQELINSVTNDISLWFMQKGKEYKEYLG